MTSKNAKQPSLLHDPYFTPAWLVGQCLEHVVSASMCSPPQSILEPGAGSGAFVSQCRDRYPDCHIDAVDLISYDCDGATNRFLGDFLQPISGLRTGYDLVIGNPPFSLALPFVMRSLGLGETVIFLLRQGFLSSHARNAFFLRTPPASVWIVPNRPNFLANKSGSQQKSQGDSADYCFVVWRRPHAGVTELRWLPSLSKGRRTS